MAVTGLLKRSYTPFGVWGVLELIKENSDALLTLATLELPWEENKRGISCIPPGRYLCRRVDSPSFGNTFEVCDVPGRSHILFHEGNDIRDTEGCILLGLRHAIWSDRIKVRSSKLALEAFRDCLAGERQFDLIIYTNQPEYP